MAPRSLLLTLIFSTSSRRHLAGVGAGQRVGQAIAGVGLGGDEDGAVGFSGEEVPGGERIEHRGGSRVAGRGQRGHLLRRLLVAAGETVDEGPEVGGRCRRDQHQPEKHRGQC